jgi:hypothetical protein
MGHPLRLRQNIASHAVADLFRRLEAVGPRMGVDADAFGGA